MSKENNTIEIFKFAGMVCLVCSLVVSLSAVSLRGIQQRNADNEKKINIIRAAGLAGAKEKLSSQQIDEKFAQIIPLVVDLKTGALNTEKNPLVYDMYAEAQGKNGHVLENDPASIKRIADVGTAYVLLDGDAISRVILPIQGYGLWSTMYGFTALSFKDGVPEISGINFYRQSETPGLGARITEPEWQAKWQGLLPYDAQGLVNVDVSKKASARNQVDAIAGATLTSNGVENLMNFWLGEQGYQPFIKHIQDGSISVEQLRDAGHVNQSGEM